MTPKRKARKPRDLYEPAIGLYLTDHNNVCLRVGQWAKDEPVIQFWLTPSEADRLGRKLIEMSKYLREKKEK